MDTLKKLLNATKEATLPDVPGTFGKLSKLLLLTSVGILTASPGWAVVVAPTSIVVSVPAGSNNSQPAGNITYTGNGGASGATTSALSSNGQTVTNAFVDDILLSSITFAGTTISSTSNPATTRIRPGLSNTQGTGALVSSGRNFISATYGGTSVTSPTPPNTTRDTGSDGNPNPYVTSSGNPNAVYVAPGPGAQTAAAQDSAIQAAFSSLSLSQG